MILKYKTKGFVFRKKEKSDSDQAFMVFTEDFGKIEITAKAVRKIKSKLRSNIDIFYFSEVEFVQGKSIKTLTDSAKIFNPIKNLRALEVAVRISDILNLFIKGQEADVEIFRLLENIFLKMNANKLKPENYNLIFHYFFWNFISLQGYHLQFNCCSICKNKISQNEINFSNKDGGIICADCLNKSHEAKKIDVDTVKILRIIMDKKIETVMRLRIGSAPKEILENICQSAINTFCPN